MINLFYSQYNLEASFLIKSTINVSSCCHKFKSLSFESLAFFSQFQSLPFHSNVISHQLNFTLFDKLDHWNFCTMVINTEIPLLMCYFVFFVITNPYKILGVHKKIEKKQYTYIVLRPKMAMKLMINGLVNISMI